MLLKVSSLEWMLADCAVNSVLDEVKLHYNIINNLAFIVDDCGCVCRCC